MAENQQPPRNVTSFFLRLGYDIEDNADVQRLADNLRYIERLRLKFEDRDSNKMAWTISAMIAIIGAVLTILGQSIASKWFNVTIK